MNKTTNQLLIVDDEESIRTALNIVLEDFGYQVLAASNGKEALKIIKDNHVDLVITDILMPEGDGLELINTMRRKNPEIKSIVISGGDPQYLEVSKCLGADAVLVKPFGQEDLKKMLDELLA